jgi:two-component system nitrogen regulation sensor histidine kinase NtrY
LLDAYSNIRELDEAIIFKGSSGEILAQSRFAYSFIFSQYPREHIEKASFNEVVLLPTNKDRIRLLIKLGEFDDTYLVIGRIIDDKIIEYIDKSNGVAIDFHNVRTKIGSLQVKFIFIFILVSVLLLLISINIGIIFANKILNPINILVNAIKSVKQGDLSTRIKTNSDNNEMTLLSRGFNEMVTSIDEHRKDLVLVQKSLAWTDVARRVAHEIKNPLTPMQLAADRLKTKFGPKITQDREIFDRYIDTITRHIDDISKIVFNFVNFVKMPKSNYHQCNFVELIKDLVDARKTLHEDINYELSSNIDIIDFNCDKNQFNQVFVNLFQNSEEALFDIKDKKISIILRKLNDELIIIINDNGIGFPDKLLNKEIEPYVTTKPNGTGLGLSIIDRIINDHGGILKLSNNVSGGASILLRFNLKNSLNNISR